MRLVDGAAYDPAAGSWRQIADAPIELTDGTAVWTGKEMIVFGAALHGGNRAESETAIAAAYDPAADSWRLLADSQLSPQASTAAWNGERMIAWDYLNRSQTYDPDRDEWGPVERVPLQDFECSPRSVSVSETVLGDYCGQTTIYGDDGWSNISRREYVGWGFDLVAADPAVLLLGSNVDTGANVLLAYRVPTDPAAADVLLVTCGPDRPPEISTPVVRTHPDGIHIQVRGAPDTEALVVRSSSRPGWAWSSGSNGIEDEVVMAVTPGEAYATCFSGGPIAAPSPGAAQQDYEGSFTIVNPDGYWISTELTCAFDPDPHNVEAEVASASETIEAAARRIIPGINDSDVAEAAGYRNAPGNREEIRVVRDGEVVAWANGFAFRGETWSLEVTACQGSEIADA